MPSSYSSTSSVEITGANSPCSARALATDAANMGSSTVVATTVAAPRLSGLIAAEHYASSLTSQRDVDDLCRKHGVPEEYTARPAGDRRACTPPPEGALCVYAHALEARVRFPLPCFFSEVLRHFGILPSQLEPNGWGILLAYMVGCHECGVPPSLAVFRHFYSLVTIKHRRWYFFRGKDAAGLLFKVPKPIKSWKGRFFFLTSPVPWSCPVRWGEPTKSSLADPKLTSQEFEWRAKLLHANDRAVDLRTYLCETRLAAAFSSNLAGESPPPPASTRSTSIADKGADQSEKEVAATSGTEKVKMEPGRHNLALSGKKRNREEARCHSELSSLPAEHRRQEKSVAKLPGANLTSVDLSTYIGADQSMKKAVASTSGMENVKTVSCEHNSVLSGKKNVMDLTAKEKRKEGAHSEDGLSRSELNKLPTDHICSATCLCAPPGFNPKPGHLLVRDTHDVDCTGLAPDAARKLPERKLESDLSPFNYESLIQKVDNVSSCALELKRELEAREAEAVNQRQQLQKETAARVEMEKALAERDAELVALREQLKQGKPGLGKRWD